MTSDRRRLARARRTSLVHQYLQARELAREQQPIEQLSARYRAQADRIAVDLARLGLSREPPQEESRP